VTSGDALGERAPGRRHALSPFVAVDAATLAAAKATSRLDHAGAARHLARAVERLEATDASPATRFELVHALGRAHWRAGERVAAADAFEVAWRLAEQIDDPDLLARAAIGGGFSCDFSGEAGLARAERCRTALRHLGEGDSAGKARLLADLAASLVVGADRAPAQHAAAEATAMARRTGDPLAIGYALVAEQFLNQGPSQLAGRIAAAREILAIADGTREHPLEVLGRFCLIGALLEAGDPALDTEIDAQTAAVRRLREPGYVRHEVWFRCMRSLLDGKLGDAERLAMEGFEAAAAASDPDAFTVYGGQIATARWMQARGDETAPPFEQMAQEEPHTPMWRAVLAAIRVRSGALGAATALLAGLDVAAVPDDRHTLLTWSAIGEAASAVGDRAKIADAYAALAPYGERMVPIAMGVASWGPVARQLGALALALGEAETAIGHFETALELATRLSATPWIAWSELDLVEACLRGNRVTPAAAGMVAHAAELASITGLGHLAERAAELAGRVR
jgi:tetratricopeptide (TPR) repeat protein